jgi:hypothetical protein
LREERDNHKSKSESKKMKAESSIKKDGHGDRRKEERGEMNPSRIIMRIITLALKGTSKSREDLRFICRVLVMVIEIP